MFQLPFLFFTVITLNILHEFSQGGPIYVRSQSSAAVELKVFRLMGYITLG